MVLVRVATLGCIQLTWFSLTFRIKLILPYESASVRIWQLKVLLKCIMRLIWSYIVLILDTRRAIDSVRWGLVEIQILEALFWDFASVLRPIKWIARVKGRSLNGKVVVVIVILTFFQLTPLNWILTMSQLSRGSFLNPLKWIFVWRIYYRLGLVFSIKEKIIFQLTLILITNINREKIQSPSLVFRLLIMILPYKLLIICIWECSCYDLIKLSWIGVAIRLIFLLKISVVDGRLLIRSWGGIIYWMVRV